MKYILIFLCFCFLEKIYLAEEESKKVEALQFIFFSVSDDSLLGKKLDKDKIVGVLKNKNTNKTKKEIKYKIIFDDGSFFEEKKIGSFKKLLNKEDIVGILNNILDVFDEKSNEIDKEIKDLENSIKETYIKENSLNWKEEYIDEHKKEWEKQKSVKQQLKDTGLFFLGAGLGFAIDRYVLKK